MPANPNYKTLISDQRIETAANVFELAADLVEPYRAESQLEFVPRPDATRAGWGHYTSYSYQDYDRLIHSAAAVDECIQDYHLDSEPGYPFVTTYWSRTFNIGSISATMRSLILGNSAVQLFANLRRPVASYVVDEAPAARNISNIAINLHAPEREPDPIILVANIHNPINLFTGQDAALTAKTIEYYNASDQATYGARHMYSDLTVQQAESNDSALEGLLQTLR